VITFQDFTYKYPRGTEPTLKNVSLQVNKGEFLLITGCSGAGKTTLCRAMFGALHHDIGGDLSGSVTLNGRDVKEYTIGDIGKFMGVVFDDPDSQLFMPLVEDEIKFGLQARNMPSGKDDIKKALDWVGISHLMKRAPHELSGGQKQKVAIAAALSVNPEIILFDEPTSQLDPQSTIEIYEILTRLKAEGKTIVLVEQKIEDIIGKVDKIAVVDQGRVIAFGAPRDVLKSKELYTAMPYPCVSRLAIELKAPEMLLSMEEDRAIIIIDELHTLGVDGQHVFLRALENREIHLDGGPSGRKPKTIKLPPFTLIGCTTDEYALLEPLRDRFRLHLRLSAYGTEELVAILRQRAASLRMEVEPEVFHLAATRARSTPRIALRVLESIARTAAADGTTVVRVVHANKTFELEGLDAAGLTRIDRDYLRILAEANGPVRLNVLATRLNIAPQSCVKLIEQYLIRSDLITKSEGGRMLTGKGLDHVRAMTA
jgi:energy-coupling factor transporter ATP-binding protein EcfA2